MRSLIIAGAGRSGTTWLAELVDRLAPSRWVFEPFHDRVPVGARFAYRWLDPAESDSALEMFWRQALDGSLPDRWVRHLEPGHERPELVLVKTIRGNLMLGWLRQNFPSVPIIALLRDPCDVVASRLRCGWDARPVYERLRAQNLDVPNVTTQEEMHAVEWSETARAIHTAGGVHVVRYESLLADANAELEGVAAAIGVPCRPLSDAEVLQPSSVARWDEPERELTEAEMLRVLAVVEMMGVAEVEAGYASA